MSACVVTGLIICYSTLGLSTLVCQRYDIPMLRCDFTVRPARGRPLQLIFKEFTFSSTLFPGNDHEALAYRITARPFVPREQHADRYRWVAIRSQW